MFSRYFLTLCVLTLFVFSVSVSAQNEVKNEVRIDNEESSIESIEARLSLGKKVLKILKNFFKHASEECLKQAVDKCKKHWYNPSKVVQCAKDFWSIENAACLVGARMDEQTDINEIEEMEIENLEVIENIDFDESSLESIESRLNLGKKILKILKKFFKHATEDCLKAAVKKCKKHWYNPAKVVQCAKDFWSIENAACLVGSRTSAQVDVFQKDEGELENLEVIENIDFDESSLESVESRLSLGKKVLKILKKFFKHATEDCLKAAVGKCKKHWYNPAKVVQCAKDFWSIENAGCLVGARMIEQAETNDKVESEVENVPTVEVNNELEDDINEIEIEEDEDDEEFSLESIESRLSLGKKVLKILKKFFKHATTECLKKAVKKCKKHWYNPAKVIKCAKDFLSIENAACLVGA